MRKLAVIAQSWSPQQKDLYSNLIEQLTLHGVHTDTILLNSDLGQLSAKVGAPRQLLRALQYQVIDSEKLAEFREAPSRVSFSSGFENLDTILGTGLRSHQTIEICGSVPSTNSSFAMHIAASFLTHFPEAELHHIDTTGTFDPIQLEQAMSRPKDMLQRIRCTKAFRLADTLQTLEMIGALAVASSPHTSGPMLIIIEDVSEFLTGNWETMPDQAATVIQLMRYMRTLCTLGACLLVLHTTKHKGNMSIFGHQHKSSRRYEEDWDAVIDIRLLLPMKNMCTITKARHCPTPQTCDLSLNPP